MKEPAFVRQNADKWKEFEQILTNPNEASPDTYADLFVEITDDLAYARTFYPNSQVSRYLNSLAAKVHQSIYKNKRESSNRIIDFWRYELPHLFYRSHRLLLVSFIIFMGSFLIGSLSTVYDDTFVRLILGDGYVNMTLENIEEGNAMGVYKDSSPLYMFIAIAFNNVRVAFLTFVFGLFFSIGTAFILFQNGVMVGAFLTMFAQYNVLPVALKTVWLHGTLEIAAIVIAGCAGLVVGNSIIFPGTYSRTESFKRGAMQGLKTLVGLVPIIIAAAFIEGYVTRHGDSMPLALSLFIIIGSFIFMLWYFIIYPIQLNKKGKLPNVENATRELIISA